MREGFYEVMFIIRPDLDDEIIKNRVEKIKNSLVSHGVKLEKEEFIGRRHLETEFKHFKEGYYVLFYFKCDKNRLKEIENIFKISDDVIRYLIVKSEFNSILELNKSE